MGDVKRNILLKIAYDGANYAGWQLQPGKNTISREIMTAIGKVSGAESTLYASGRTDAGVHAYAQTANFYTYSEIPPKRFVQAINANLPCDIRITDAVQVEDGFNARRDALRKTYEYLIYNDMHLLPFYVNRAWLARGDLNLDAMRAAAGFLIGEHDFAAFMSSGSFVKSTIRTIFDISVSRDGKIIALKITGNGFLYNMVRIIAGTLLYVGCGKLNSEDVQSILAGKDRSFGAPTAPPDGLYLREVLYNRDF